MADDTQLMPGRLVPWQPAPKNTHKQTITPYGDHQSSQIRLKGDNYEGFLVHPDTKKPMDVDSFTANIGQAMGKEADNVEIDALSNALQLNLDLAYLNGVRTDGVDFIQFRNAQDKDEEPLTLLYRPGHYDILVKGSVTDPRRILQLSMQKRVLWRSTYASGTAGWSFQTFMWGNGG